MKSFRWLFRFLALLVALSIFQSVADAAPYAENATFSTVGTYKALPRQVGTGINKHMLVCWIEGTADAATVKLQSSVDNVTFGTDVITLTCTTGGVSSATTAAGNYFRYGLTAATNLSSGAKITVFYTGSAETLASNGGGGGGGGDIGDCSTNTGLLFDNAGTTDCRSGVTTASTGNITLSTSLILGGATITPGSGTYAISLGGSSGTVPVQIGSFSAGDFLKMDSNGRIVSGGSSSGAVVVSSGGSSVSITHGNIKANNKIVVNFGTPTCSGSGCAFVTGAQNSIFRFTTTTTGSMSTVVTFSAAFDRIPACFAIDEGIGQMMVAIPTTTNLTITGPTVSGDTIAATCFGS